MTETISQRELRNDSARIMRALADGRSFVVTSNAHPVGELRPLRRPRYARRHELLDAFRGAPRIDFEQFRADIDAHLDQDIEPRG